MERLQTSDPATLLARTLLPSRLDLLHDKPFENWAKRPKQEISPLREETEISSYTVTNRDDVRVKCAMDSLKPYALTKPISLANAIVAVSPETQLKMIRKGKDHILA